MRHRKTRTRLIIGLGLAAVMAVMSGASIAQAQPAQITMWDIPESDPYTAWWQEYVDEWNAANPDVQVKMEVFPTEEYKTKYVAALASDTLPDIFYGIPGPATQQAWKDGRIKSLDGLLDADRFAEGALSSCSFDGQVVCMPLYLGAEFVYYNKDHFAQAGIDVRLLGEPAPADVGGVLGGGRSTQGSRHPTHRARQQRRLAWHPVGLGLPEPLRRKRGVL